MRNATPPALRITTLVLLAAGSCAKHDATPNDAGDAGTLVVTAERTADRTRSGELMFAAAEMWLSGEPLAVRFGGRDLSGFDVANRAPDVWVAPSGEARVDPFGFSAGIESAEYARDHVRMVALQTTSGIPLARGPLVEARPEPWALGRMRARAQTLLIAAGADVAKIATLPAAPSDPENYLGFPGLWPTMVPFDAFDPSMTPPKQVIRCASTGFPVSDGRLPAYECQYQDLALDDRDAQVDKVVGPSTIGHAARAYALAAAAWLGPLHDGKGAHVTSVPDADLAAVGLEGNKVGGGGAFFGRNAYEGMWGAFALDAADNAAEWTLRRLAADDSGALVGFASLSEAIAYDASAPLRWFPSRIAIAEDEAAPYANVAALTVSDPRSRAEDLAALALGTAHLFALADARNAARSLGLRAAFDGAPWAGDDGAPNGEASTHDRALALMNAALVDLERLHFDPKRAVHVDAWDLSSGRAPVVGAVALAHTIVALRAARLAQDGALGFEPTDAPDGADDARGVLGASRATRTRDALAKDARFMMDVLTRPDGTVRASARLAELGEPLPDAAPAPLDAQAAVVRALSDAFRATGDEAFRARARAVARRLLVGFFSPALRAWRGADGGADEVTMTAATFAWLTGALRDAYVLLAIPNDVALDRAGLEIVIARTNKLILDGWDDRDRDGHVGEGECLGARLQLAEQVKTGELGKDSQRRYVEDRDGDCVWTISFARQGSVLAGGVRFATRRR